MSELISNIGFLAYPLLILSVLSLSIIINRTVFVLKFGKIENCENLTKLEATLKANKSKPKVLRDELLAFLLIDLKTSYDFGIKTLRLIATISPMVGLLGTVVGIIKVFKTISLETGPVTPALISEGLWNAMMTTAIGLSIALPSLMAAFIFSRFNEKRIEAYQARLKKSSFPIDGVKL